MSSGWDGQYDAFQGQTGFYDPNYSQYNYSDASVGNGQHGGNGQPTFMTPTDPYAPMDQQGNPRLHLGIFWTDGDRGFLHVVFKILPS